MGIVIGTWRHPSSCPGRGEPLTPRTVAEGLRDATGLAVALGPDGELRLPTLRTSLFDWEADGGAVTLSGTVPAHPYLWENLDAVMTTLGGRRDEAGHLWRPDPAHAWLRRRWDGLSPRDRRILAMPSVLGLRPLDRLLRRPR